MNPIELPHLTLRKTLIVMTNALLVCGFIGYILFQARFLLQGPVISFDQSADLVQAKPVVTLSGQASNITSLTLNGREIYTDQAGYFTETLVLENGYTVATIMARDRYGRERAYEQRFVYTGSQNNNQSL